MRFVLSVVLALSVGIGAYFGSARAASSAQAHPRMVLLRKGEIAAVGPYGPRAQCQATLGIEDRSARLLRCSPGPLSRATYSILLASNGFEVFKKGVPDPVYSTYNTP